MIPRILNLFKKHSHILITTHVHPDPDGLCSELALAIYLRSLGKKVTIVHHDETPARFLFLPGAKGIQAYQKNMHVNFDLAIIVDCGELKRIGRVQNLLTPDKKIVNIDHHITNSYFGDYNLVDCQISSTTQLLYNLFKKAKYPLTRDTALLLYTGIMTDTGSFRYENTIGATHQITADLLKFPISPQRIYRQIYEKIPLKDFQKFIRILNQFDTYYKGSVIFVFLRKRQLKQFTDEFDLKDAIFRSLRAIGCVKVIAIFTQVGARKTKVNFRSMNKINVARLSALFDGGGHRQAAGCLIEKDLNKSAQIVLKEIKKAL